MKTKININIEMEPLEMELSEPIVRMLAHAYRYGLWGSFMEKYGEEIEDEGSVSWYEDEFDKFFWEVCDADDELTRWRKEKK